MPKRKIEIHERCSVYSASATESVCFRFWEVIAHDEYGCRICLGSFNKFEDAVQKLSNLDWNNLPDSWQYPKGIAL